MPFLFAGNGGPVPLVGTDGTVDWYCPSRFDAPSLFGALLDAKKGGHFSLRSRGSGRPKQLYLPDTNILLTRFQGAEAVGEVIDFMAPETSSTRRARDLLVRQARAVRGRATFELACHPAFDYGRAPHTVQLVTGVAATFTLEEGQSVDGAAFGARAETAGLPPRRRPGRGTRHVACPSCWAAAVTGITGTAGCATRRSPCTR